MPPTLLTGTATKFDGDPAEVTLVTNDSILAAYDGNAFGEQTFLANVMGCSCGGVLKTKQEFLDDSTAAFDELTIPLPVIPPCTWHRLYAPMAFSGDFKKTTGDDGGWSLWGMRGLGLWWHQPHIKPGGEGVYQTWDPVPFQILWWGEQPHRDNFSDGEGVFDPPVETFNWLGPAPRLEVIDTCQGNNHTICLNKVIYGTETLDKLSYERPDGQEGLYMPIPPIPDLGISTPPPLAVCGGFNLSAVTDVDAADIVIRGGGLRSIVDIASAYSGDTDENKATYARATQIPNSLNVPELEATFDAATDAQLNEIIDDQLNRADPAVLATIEQAYLKGSAEIKTALLVDFARDALTYDVLTAFTQPGEEVILMDDYVKQIMLRAHANPFLKFAVELDETSAATGFTYNINTDGVGTITLKIGTDVVSKTVKKTNVLVRHCDGPYLLKVVTETALDSDLQPVDNKLFMQLLLDKLDQILQCCNPCPEVIPDGDPDALFWGHQTSRGEPPEIISPDIPGLSRVQLNVVENLFPKIWEFGPPDLALLAKFAWRDLHGRYGPILYVNMDNTDLYVPNDETIGFMVHCYPGVVLQAHWRTKTNFVPPDEPPALTQGQP